MRFILFSVVVVCTFSSCEIAEFIQHTPTLANTGQHTGKDQLHGKVLYSTGSSTSNSGNTIDGTNPYESVNGIQGQGSYSFHSKFAFHASFMHSSEKGGSETNGQKNIVYNYKRNITETGFTFFDDLNKANSLFFELAAGTGFGKFNASEVSSILAPDGRFYNHNVFKLYLQPSFYYASRNLCMAAGTKFSAIKFSSISTNYTSNERTTRSINNGTSLQTNTLDFFMKTDVYLNQIPWLGFNVQFLYSSDIKKKFNYNQNDWNTGIGLSFRLDKLNVKK